MGLLPERRSGGMTRWVNRMFKSCTSGPEFYDYGVYTPPPKMRRPSNVPSSSSSSSSVPSVSSSSNSQERALREEATAKVAAEKAAEEARLVAKKEMEKKSKEYESKFNEFSGGKKSLILHEVSKFAYAMGFAPTASDMINYEKNNPGEFTLKVFMEMMTVVGNGVETEDDLMVLFKHFDRTDTGKMSKSKVINILTSFGEPLTHEEANLLLIECDVNTDPVDYKKLVHNLLN